METRRLRTLQTPSEVEKLLEDVVSKGYSLPKDCHPVRDLRALSAPLRALVVQAAQDGRVWTCWGTNFDMWLFTGEMSLSLSRERGAPVLLVHRYGERGELHSAEHWMSDPQGKWVQCRV
jgi:hypothetical protein